MQVSMDGTVKYAGHKIINYKDGRRFVSLTVVDEKGEPLELFCPEKCIPVAESCHWGDELQVVFRVNAFRNTLTLRPDEVLKYA